MARITTYFSGKDDLQAIILGQLAVARSTIHVAVAWFTDTTLFQQLLERQLSGVKVELIITDHIFNDQSANNYKQVEAGGGLFLKLGSDAQLMHHKFCIVDRKVLLQGSFNWTKRANQSNNETLTLIEEDPASVNQFLAEYERLKQSAGVEAQTQELRLAEAFKYFQLIRAFISLGKSTEVNAYAHEMKGIAELEQIVALLFVGDYQGATEAMNAFEKKHQQLVDVSAAERAFLLSRIRMLNELIKQLVGEREDIRGEIERYLHRYRIELHGLIARILRMKKKIYDKFKKYGVEDETFANAEAEYERVSTEYEEAKKVEVADLDPEQEKDLKAMYREAAALCHPDSTQCVFKDDLAKANVVFGRLSQAYKSNDIETVREILAQLKLGRWNGVNETDALETLRIQLTTLEIRYQAVMRDLEQLKTSEPYLVIEKVQDWDQYFADERTNLEAQLDQLNEQFGKTPDPKP